jgi:hypothetical protein
MTLFLVFAFYVVVFYVLVFGLMPWSWSHVLVLMEGAAKKSIQGKARTRQDKTRQDKTQDNLARRVFHIDMEE